MPRSAPASLLILLLLAPPSDAFVLEPSVYEAARTCDLVVVARPVRFQRLRVSRYKAYELVTCELERTLRGGDVWSVDDDALLPRFCVFRQYDGGAVQFERQELIAGVRYVFALQQLEPDGSYAPVSNYHPFVEATDAAVAAFQEAIYGDARGPLATEGLGDAQGRAHALAVAERLEANVQALGIEDGATLLPRLAEPRTLVGDVADDRRVCLVQAECSWRVEAPSVGDAEPQWAEGDLLPSYSPLAADSDQGVGYAVHGDTVEATETWSVVPVVLTLNGLRVGPVLAANKRIATPRGEVTLTVYVKVAAGPIGVAEAREVDQDEDETASESGAVFMAQDVVSASGARALCRQIVPLEELDEDDEAAEDAQWLLRMGAEVVLSDAGASAVDATATLLASSDDEVVTLAFNALTQMGAQAIEALPVLLGELRASDVERRESAAETIGAIGRLAHSAVQPLIERLGDAAPVRAAAATALGQIGPRALAAVPRLCELLDSEAAGDARASAAEALGEIGLEGAALAVPALIRALGPADGNVRAAAANGLRGFGEAAAPAVPALIRVVRLGQEAAFVAAARTLGALGRHAEAALPALKEHLRDSNSWVRSAAYYATSEIHESLGLPPPARGD